MQGELFTADIHSFPSSRRVNLVRDTAKNLAALEIDHPAEADVLWTDVCNRIIDENIQAGISQSHAAQDLIDFAAAVHVEIQKVVLRMMQA